MCGICGFVTAGPGDRADLERMTSALDHRGPDDAGYHLEPVPAGRAGDGGAPHSVALGHGRLSIIDLSPAGRQPMFNEDGSVALVCNGEIYHYRDLRRDLTALGHQFHSKSDSEVIVHGYEAWGPAVLDRLNGMFALALWDRRHRRLLLARDRLWIKPVYHHVADGSLLFASEVSALRRHRSFRPQIDWEALGLYLDFSYVPAPKTIYRNTRKLLPGEALVWEPSGIRTGRYWSLGTDRDAVMSFAEARERCAALIRDPVEMRLASDVPLGAFLSGGHDSSLVAAMMKSAGTADVDTYAIEFEDPAYDEPPFARAVAEHLGTPHHELILTAEEAIRALTTISTVYDEPFGDSSALPANMISRFAREFGMVVALSGDGGDELFCGYHRYRTALRLHRLAAVPAPLRRFGGALLRCCPSHKCRRLAADARFESLAELYHQRMSSWKDGDPCALVAPGGRRAAGGRRARVGAGGVRADLFSRGVPPLPRPGRAGAPFAGRHSHLYGRRRSDQGGPRQLGRVAGGEGAAPRPPRGGVRRGSAGVVPCR